MTGECAGVLKQRPMTGVWVDDELRIGHMRAKSERVHRRDQPLQIHAGLADYLLGALVFG